MVGAHLLRFDQEQKWAVFDIESNGLSLFYSLPWEISYATATLKNGIQSIQTEMIRWPNFQITDELARKVHFDRARYEAEAKPPEEVWSRFASILYSPEYRALGHRLLGFDIYMISVWRRAIGLPVDHSWRGGGDRWPVVDTDCLAKAYWKKWAPDLSSPDAFLAFQYRCEQWVEKGLKSNLGLMCKTFGVEYDEASAHSAEYDIGRNWLMFKEMVWKMEC